MRAAVHGAKTGHRWDMIGGLEETSNVKQQPSTTRRVYRGTGDQECKPARTCMWLGMAL